MIMRDLALLGLVLGAVLSTTPAQGEGVVLSSTAPGMVIGRVLADDDVVHLPDDTITTVLMVTGQVVKVTGPFDGKLAAAGAPPVNVTLLGDWTGIDLSTLGGTRGDRLPAVAGPAADAPIAVDATRPGNWCLTGGIPVRLLPPSGPGRLDLQDAATGAAAALGWPPAVGMQPWPAAIPLGDGTTVMARWNQGPPFPLRFHHLGNSDGPPLTLLLRWALAGCHGQADPILAALGQRSAEFAVSLTTERGRTPRYAIGEDVTLILQSNRPARLFCFLFDESGMTPLTAAGGLPIPDHKEIRIPGEEVAVRIAARPPPGLGEIRCYAVAPAIAITLPPGGRDAAARLDQMVLGLPEEDRAVARLTLRIE